MGEVTARLLGSGDAFGSRGRFQTHRLAPREDTAEDVIHPSDGADT
jgi:hypothetical protein